MFKIVLTAQLRTLYLLYFAMGHHSVVVRQRIHMQYYYLYAAVIPRREVIKEWQVTVAIARHVHVHE